MPSPIVTRTGAFAKPNVLHPILDAEWVVTPSHDFYLKSKEPMASYSNISYKEVRVEEVGNGFTLHKFHGLGLHDGHKLVVEQVEQDNSGVGGIGNQVGRVEPAGYGYPYNANLVLHGLWNQPIQTLVYGAGNYKDGSIGPVLLQETNYDYYTYTQPKLYNTSVSELMQRSVVGITHLSNEIGYLKSVENRIYEKSTPNKYITSTTEYSYGTNHLLPIETRKANSDGIIHISKTKYSFDYDCSNVTTSNIAGAAIDLMQNRNMIVPIEQTALIDKGSGLEVIGGIVSKFKYDATSNSILAEEMYSLETATPLLESTNFTVSAINSSGTQFVKDSRYALKGIASKYDDLGNIVTYQPTGNISTTIIWDAQGDLPMGKATNANFDEVFYTSFEEISGGLPKGKTGQKSNIGSYTIDVSNINTSLSNNNFILSYWKSSDGNNWDFVKQQISITGNITISPSGANYIDDVRLYPSDAIMSTVVFDSHTRQVTHMADENGHTLEYKYNKLQGLYEVIDFEGNVISRNEYNYAQSGGTGNDVYNFVKTFKFLEAGVSTGGSPTNLDNQLEQIQFIDGIGRPIQSIAVQQAANKGDIVSHIEYDGFGRENKQFSPFVMGSATSSNGGNFILNAANRQYLYNITQYGTQTSYAESEFDNSPLNRVVEQGAVGTLWQPGTGNTLRTTWRTNDYQEVRNLHSSGTYYPPNTLWVTETEDENDVKSWQFTDHLGRTIMTSREIGTDKAETYYQYDDFGRVERVYSPEAVNAMNNTGWSALSPSDNLRYDYTYDARGRMLTKKIPGAAEIRIVYDNLDRVVLTQDGNQRASGKNDWTFTKYDILSRPIMTGIYTATSGDTQSDLQTDVDAESDKYEDRTNGGVEGYTTKAFPSAATDYEALTVTYYDNYDFDGDGTDDTSPDPTYLNGAIYAHLHGKLTGTRVKILDADRFTTNPNWLKTVTFSDKRGRVIQINAQNHMGGADITSNQYDFAGRMLQTVREHTTSSTDDIYILSQFGYDHAGRLLTTTYGVGEDFAEASSRQINITTQEYNQLGRLIEKKLHETSSNKYLQNIDYKYNIRGWLTDINNVNFGGLTSVALSEEISKGLISKIKDSDIEVELNVNDLNAGIYDEVEVKNKRTEEQAGQTTQRNEAETRELESTTTQSALINNLKIDYTGQELTDANYEQEMTKLRTDLDAQMDNLGITDQKARDLVEDEVMSYFKDNWILTVANDNDNDLFSMHFDYTLSNTNSGAQAQYNGNISQITWRVRGDANKSIYGFQYDDLNRLTNAKYVQRDGNSNYVNADDYTVSNITYDLNGNIQTLDRMGFDGAGYTLIDQLSYTYDNNSNILKSVSDAINDNRGFKETNQSGTDYTYDANGNMVSDYNKGVTITYNQLNLPAQVQLSNGRTIRWIYDAAGVKLTKSTIDGAGNTTEKQYIGGIEYIKGGSSYTVEAIYHNEGRLILKEEVTEKENPYQYEYTMTDHLGNARVTFADLDGNGVVNETEILQTNHYYPFGMVMEGNQVNQQGITNHYQYNGKELNTDFGLDWLDYGARWYDASIGRFSVIDRFAEKYYDLNSYHYCANNPVNLIDINGDSLDIPKLDKQAEFNLRKMIPSSKKYQKRLEVDPETGNVTFDTEGLSEKDIKKGGSGLELLLKLTKEKKWYLYATTIEEVNETEAYGEQREEGRSEIALTGRAPDVTYPRRPNFKYLGKYDGLAITRKAYLIFYEKDGSSFTDKSYTALTFHALAEMYYLANDANYDYKTAHNMADDASKRFYKPIFSGTTHGFIIFDNDGKVYNHKENGKIIVKQGKKVKN